MNYIKLKNYLDLMIDSDKEMKEMFELLIELNKRDTIEQLMKQIADGSLYCDEFEDLTDDQYNSLINSSIERLTTTQ